MAVKKSGFADKWQALPAKRRQQIALFGVLGGVALVSFVLLTGSGATTTSQDPLKIDSKVENSLLPDGNTRDIGMSGVANDVEGLRDETENLKENVSRLEELQKQRERTARNGGADRARDEQMRAEMEELRRQVELLQQGGVGKAPDSAEPSPANAPPVAYGGIRTIGNSAAATSRSSAVDAALDGSSAAVDGGLAEGQDAPPKMYLPSGAIIQGVMLTGLDAPTGKGAMQDPVPVLVRIQKDAILPNRFRADVKECFALVAGHGDLASERAYLRSESISCVRKDKGVIDLAMKAYIVDTDGKAGLRGRIVSKQGSALSKAIIAAFADGVSQAFKGQSQPLRLGGEETVDYGNAGYAGAVMGASSALDRISKYYLDLADQMFPVLEIDAGRQVTLVLVKGMEMTEVR